MTVPIVTLADAKSRMKHHQSELEKAWRRHYGAAAQVRIFRDVSLGGAVSIDPRDSQRSLTTSVSMICADGSHLKA